MVSEVECGRSCLVVLLWIFFSEAKVFYKGGLSPMEKQLDEDLAYLLPLTTSSFRHLKEEKPVEKSCVWDGKYFPCDSEENHRNWKVGSKKKSAETLLWQLIKEAFQEASTPLAFPKYLVSENLFTQNNSDFNPVTSKQPFKTTCSMGHNVNRSGNSLLQMFLSDIPGTDCALKSISDRTPCKGVIPREKVPQFLKAEPCKSENNKNIPLEGMMIDKLKPDLINNEINYSLSPELLESKFHRFNKIFTTSLPNSAVESPVYEYYGIQSTEKAFGSFGKHGPLMYEKLMYMTKMVDPQDDDDPTTKEYSPQWTTDSFHSPISKVNEFPWMWSAPEIFAGENVIESSSDNPSSRIPNDKTYDILDKEKMMMMLTPRTPNISDNKGEAPMASWAKHLPTATKVVVQTPKSQKGNDCKVWVDEEKKLVSLIPWKNFDEKALSESLLSINKTLDGHDFINKFIQKQNLLNENLKEIQTIEPEGSQSAKCFTPKPCGLQVSQNVLCTEKDCDDTKENLQNSEQDRLKFNSTNDGDNLKNQNLDSLTSVTENCNKTTGYSSETVTEHLVSDSDSNLRKNKIKFENFIDTPNTVTVQNKDFSNNTTDSNRKKIKINDVLQELIELATAKLDSEGHTISCESKSPESTSEFASQTIPIDIKFTTEASELITKEGFESTPRRFDSASRLHSFLEKILDRFSIQTINRRTETLSLGADGMTFMADVTETTQSLPQSESITLTNATELIQQSTSTILSQSSTGDGNSSPNTPTDILPSTTQAISDVYMTSYESLKPPEVNTTTTLDNMDSDPGEVAILTKNVNDILTYLYSCTANILHKAAVANWNYSTSPSYKTQQMFMVSKLEVEEFHQRLNRALEPLLTTAEDADLRRQMTLLYLDGMDTLPDIKMAEMGEVLFAMETIFSSASVPDYNVPSKRLSMSEVVDKMTSNDTTECRYYWYQWREASGKKIKNLFEQYVELVNMTAIYNGFKDGEEMWTRHYETEDFAAVMNSQWDEVRPLYMEIHAHVRAALIRAYGDIGSHGYHGPIPSHYTRNLWAEEWTQLYNLTAPFPEVPLEYTSWSSKGLSVYRMVETCERWYEAIGLGRLPESVWRRSVLTQKTGFPSAAWDMYRPPDFRISMSYAGSVEDLLSLHSHVCHIACGRARTDLPLPFRRSPCPGFDNALAGAICLAVRSPAHATRLGLLTPLRTTQAHLNFLYKVALETVTPLPFSLSVDLWRYGIFKGKFPPSAFNYYWWSTRQRYCGVSPALWRELDDFDPGSKYEVIANKPYIQKFVAGLMQFQIYEAVCIKSGALKPGAPLHMCDLYGTRMAGKMLKATMALGGSKHWRSALDSIAGTRHISGKSLMNYFKPLYEHLRQSNLRSGARIGWNDDGIDASF